MSPPSLDKTDLILLAFGFVIFIRKGRSILNNNLWNNAGDFNDIRADNDFIINCILAENHIKDVFFEVESRLLSIKSKTKFWRGNIVFYVKFFLGVW